MYKLTLTKTIEVVVEAESEEEARRSALKFNDQGEYDLNWDLQSINVTHWEPWDVFTTVTNQDKSWKESWDDVITAGSFQVKSYEERKEELHNRKIYNTLEELRANTYPEELG